MKWAEGPCHGEHPATVGGDSRKEYDAVMGNILAPLRLCEKLNWDFSRKAAKIAKQDFLGSM